MKYKNLFLVSNPNKEPDLRHVNPYNRMQFNAIEFIQLIFLHSLVTGEGGYSLCIQFDIFYSYTGLGGISLHHCMVIETIDGIKWMANISRSLVQCCVWVRYIGYIERIQWGFEKL